MTKQVKLGIIGCGHIAELVHLNVLARIPNVEVSGVADCDAKRLELFNQRAPTARCFDDYRELLRTSAIQAVVICLPSLLHAEAAIAAFENGKHVYLEKPLATNLEDAERTCIAWKKANTVGMIGFNYRYNPLFRELRAHIASGSIGALVGAHSVFATPKREIPVWKRTRTAGGGVLLEFASHHIDLVHFFFGQEIREVHAEIKSYASEGDTASLQFTLDNGLCVQSFFSFTAIEEDRFEIFGDKGRLAVDRYRSSAVEVVKSGEEFSMRKRVERGFSQLSGAAYRIKKALATAQELSYRTALGVFVDAVRGSTFATPDLEDGLRSLKVIDAAERSARNGTEVLLNDSPHAT
ncbi:MAG: Gfo/Idh/MocA family oxidoreductase [Anaerolineae bacterium]|nr:Gfo/Idh/MocA family oxidoreductase [Gemmatimonadaceae bacterium]